MHTYSVFERKIIIYPYLKGNYKFLFFNHLLFEFKNCCILFYVSIFVVMCVRPSAGRYVSNNNGKRDDDIFNKNVHNINFMYKMWQMCDLCFVVLVSSLKKYNKLYFSLVFTRLIKKEILRMRHIHLIYLHSQFHETYIINILICWEEKNSRTKCCLQSHYMPLKLNLSTSNSSRLPACLPVCNQLTK